MAGSKRLRLKEIFLQLKNFEIEKPAVLYVHSIRQIVLADFLTFTSIQQNLLRDSWGATAYQYFQTNPSSALVILIDPHRENDGPVSSDGRSEEVQTQRSLTQLMSHLLRLTRYLKLRQFFFDNPDRLIVASIINRKITVYNGRGAEMINCFKEENPTPEV
jgi:hypothetical protein